MFHSLRMMYCASQQNSARGGAKTPTTTWRVGRPRPSPSHRRLTDIEGHDDSAARPDLHMLLRLHAGEGPSSC